MTNFLKGYKTYAAIVVGALAMIACLFNKINAQTATYIIYGSGFGALAFARMAIARVEAFLPDVIAVSKTVLDVSTDVQQNVTSLAAALPPTPVSTTQNTQANAQGGSPDVSTTQSAV